MRTRIAGGQPRQASLRPLSVGLTLSAVLAMGIALTTSATHRVARASTVAPSQAETAAAIRNAYGPRVDARRVVGYFPIWLRNKGYTPKDIDFSIVNTIAHFSLTPQADGDIEIPGWGPFPDPDLIATAHGAGVSVVLVVGGDHAAATAGFSAMSANPGARARFITNVTALVWANGYDGVDLDWEFPTTAADRADYAALVSELRAALGWDRTLSITGPATDWWGQWFDLESMLPNLDWIGAMTYALSGATWSQHADHSSALYTSAEGEASVDASTAYYLGRGVPADKLLIGLPFYGERFDDATALHQPLSGRDGGAIDYPDVTTLINNGWIYQRDTVADVPYLVNAGGTGIISYDDATSIAAKCDYVNAHGIGGTIIWHLGKDRIGGAQPLLAAAAGCR
jgi:chitinase